MRLKTVLPAKVSRLKSSVRRRSRAGLQPGVVRDQANEGKLTLAPPRLARSLHQQSSSRPPARPVGAHKQAVDLHISTGCLRTSYSLGCWSRCAYFSWPAAGRGGSSDCWRPRMNGSPAKPLQCISSAIARFEGSAWNYCPKQVCEDLKRGHAAVSALIT